MPNSLIVYHNPLEKMLWEGNWGIYLIYFLAFSIPLVLVLKAFSNPRIHMSNLMQFVMWFSAIGSGVISCFSLYFIMTL